MPGVNIDHTTTKPTYTYSQSWLNTFANCPEQARQDMLNPVDAPSDATAIGQALHAYAEARLDGQDLTTAAKLAVAAFDEQAANPLFQWAKVKTRQTAVKHIKEVCSGWEIDVLPHLGEVVSIEEEFDILLCETDTAVIRLMGAWDLEVRGGTWGFHPEPTELVDWKTASRPYEPWEARRFKIQPTVYTLALADKYGLRNDDCTIDFTYQVAIKGTGPTATIQPVPAPRNQLHWKWLEQQCVAITELIEQDLGVWPLNDQGWHCSPKWCAHWAGCKGLVFGDDPW